MGTHGTNGTYVFDLARAWSVMHSSVTLPVEHEHDALSAPPARDLRKQLRRLAYVVCRPRNY